MTDLHMIRDLLSEEPAAAEVVAEGRSRLRATYGRRRMRRTGLGLGLVAAGAAAAVVVSVAGTGGEGGTVRPSTAPPVKDAFLLAAAKAETLPTGSYWFSDQVEGQSYLVKGTGGGRYAVDATNSEFFQWVARKVGGGDLFYGRDLPFHPWTAADRKAWRLAGSPTTLKVWANDHYDTVVSKSGRWDADLPQAGKGGRFGFPGRGEDLTVEQLENLPTDPAKLAEMIFSRGAKATDPAAVAKQTMLSDPAHRLMTVGDLMMNTPLLPKVQAALMRMLVAQPGVRRLGTVTDPLGRTGIAIGGDWVWNSAIKDPGYGVQEQLIFDAKTGAFLADQKVLTRPGGIYASQRPGFIVNYWLLRHSGWTDTKPTPPTTLPTWPLH